MEDAIFGYLSHDRWYLQKQTWKIFPNVYNNSIIFPIHRWASRNLVREWEFWQDPDMEYNTDRGFNSTWMWLQYSSYPTAFTYQKYSINIHIYHSYKWLNAHNYLNINMLYIEPNVLCWCYWGSLFFYFFIVQTSLLLNIFLYNKLEFIKLVNTKQYLLCILIERNFLNKDATLFVLNMLQRVMRR